MCRRMIVFNKEIISVVSRFVRKSGKCSDSSQSNLFVYVIAWAREQLRINFTSIFKVFTKLPESRSDEGNLENFENTNEINP